MLLDDGLTQEELDEAAAEARQLAVMDRISALMESNPWFPYGGSQA
jgi:hypothetical protein